MSAKTISMKQLKLKK